MKTYIYKVTPNSTVRGANRTIEAYRMKRNKPIYLGMNDHINTASYKGDLPCAMELVAEIEHLGFSGYALTGKNIQVFEV